MVCWQQLQCCAVKPSVVLPRRYLLLAVPHVLLLLLLLPSALAVYPAVRSPHHCHISDGPVESNRPEYLYINDEEMPLTIAVSHRPAHQLLTEVVAVLLRQMMGYANILIYTPPARGLLASPLLKVIEERDFYPIPRYMLDLLVWSNPAHAINSDTFDTTGYLGNGGRLGWFLPSHLLSDYNMLDHWRTYTVRGGHGVKRFYRTRQELKELSPLLMTASGVPHCQEHWCADGLFTPPWCEEDKCALLFASDVDTGMFLHEQITKERMYVQVAFFGPNLNEDLVQRNLDLGDGRSLLVFHWTPSVLLQGFNVTAVSFMPCNLVVGATAPDYLCHYELHRFNKYLWAELKLQASSLFDAIERINLDSVEFDSLVSEFAKHSPNTSMADMACHWINTQHDTWYNWRMNHPPIKLIVLGFFPVSKASDQTSVSLSSVSRDQHVQRSGWFVKDKFIAPGNVPAFKMAIEAINANTSILPGYHLDYITLNGACEPDLVMVNFINLIVHYTRWNALRRIVGIVGPACSDTVIPLAGVTNHYHIPIISYGAEGAIFTDQNEYPYFFRTIPENKIYRYVYLKLFMKMGWSRIASLTEDGQRYSEYITPLHELLEAHGMVFVMRKYRHDKETMNMASHLKFLRDQRTTVIIGNFYEDVARTVMCKAYRMNMTACQGYVWILPQWYSADWYNTTDKSSEGLVDCTTEEMLLAIEGHMSLSYKYFGEKDQIMQENITVGEWRSNYEDKVAELNRNTSMPVEVSEYAGFTYDAVWSYAIALDQLAEQNRSFMSNLRSTKSLNAFIKNLEALSFMGASGALSFRHGHSRVTDIELSQFTAGNYSVVANFFADPLDAANNNLSLYPDALSWPCGVPRDKLEACVVEGFRYLLGVSCTTAIVVLCLALFVFMAIFPIACVFIIKRNYDRKVQEMQALWRDCNIFSKFNGWQIRRDNLVLNRRLGEGQFGIIYGGECNIEGHGWVAVAVKTLKCGSTIAEKLDFLSEADLMKTLQHDNIVKLLGVCTDGEPIYAVMEFMLYGDLKTYLLARRNLVYNKARNDNDEVSNYRLSSMVRDIAKGLQFLSEHKYVHRDIACRNCLVNVYKAVKIGDFGMTRLVYESNYYRFSRKGMLPVRWMAPESLMEGLYTSMSDMWSYGVLLYEVITFGAFPFQNMSNNQVLEYVRAHNTLRPPPGINPLLEGMLQQCWQFCPSRRPTAKQVVNTLTTNPLLVSPSLDSPQNSVQAEIGNTAPLQPINPRVSVRPAPTTTSLTRRLHPQRLGQNGLSVLHYSRHSSLSSASSRNQPGRNSSGTSSGSGNGGLFSSNGRKRSMSGNMAVPHITGSLSDTTIGGQHHTTLDALNLSVAAVVIEEKSVDGDCVDGRVMMGNCVEEVGESSGYASTGTGTGGESSGYNSTGTGTGGSNTSGTRTEQYEPAAVNPNRSVMAGSLGAKLASSNKVLNNRTNDSGSRTNVTEGDRTVEARILNSPNMFYLSESDRTFVNSTVSTEDEGAIPLLPQVRYSSDVNSNCRSDNRGSSSDNIRLTARRRTPTLESHDDDVATELRVPLSACGPSAPVSTAASNA